MAEILIIGGGFGGLGAASRLCKSGLGLDIALIDKKETADFLPMLPDCIGGLCLILGLFTRISASLLFILIVVAALKVHIGKGFFLADGGYEYAFIIDCMCLALIISGGGKISLLKKF